MATQERWEKKSCHMRHKYILKICAQYQKKQTKKACTYAIQKAWMRKNHNKNCGKLR